MVDSSRVDVGRTVAEEGDAGGEGEELAEAESEDMMCVRGTVSYELGEPSGSWKEATFVRGMMDVLVEGALATQPADVEPFPCQSNQTGPNSGTGRYSHRCCGHVAPPEPQCSRPSLKSCPTNGPKPTERSSSSHHLIHELT